MFEKKKTYIAYTINHHEYGCGCPYTTTSTVYNSGRREFDTYEKAMKAAITQANARNADDWKVI